MPRPQKPWWWSARKRWAATIEGVRYVEPTGLGKSETHAAWEWHARLLATERPAAPSGDRLGDLFEAYLEWDERRVEAGERDRRAHETLAYKLNRIFLTQVDGKDVGFIPARKFGPGHIEAMLLAWAGAGLSPGYRRELVAAVKMVLSWATRPLGSRPPLLEKSPLAGFKLPPAEVVAERYAGRSEAAAWLRWLWRRGLREFALLQRCLVHTGARPKELTTLTYGNIRWDALETPSGHAMGVATLEKWKAARKTGRLRRIYIPARLGRMLKRRMIAANDPNVRIWTAPRGGEWSSSNLATYTARQRDMAIAAGLPFSDAGPDRLVNYRWRHTAASSLLMNGVPIATVATLLGTSVQMISKVYGHLMSDHLGDAAEQLARGRRPGSR